MLTPLLVGLLIGGIGFAVLEVVSKHLRKFMLPTLLLHVAIGTTLQFAFNDGLGTIYLLAWMLANMVGIGIGFVRRAMLK